MMPVIKGKVHHFKAKGLYNGMPLLYDEESGSYWDHITGRSIYGPLAGTQLETAVLLPLTVYQAYTTFPHLRVAIAASSFRQKATSSLARRWGRHLLAPLLKKYNEDTRLARFEIGLGVWSEDEKGYDAHFYRMDYIRDQGGVAVTQFGGRNLLLFIEPENKIPGAIYSEAQAGFWIDGKLHLENGLQWRDGLVHNQAGEVVEVERPLQMYSRWYGFSFTFPGCDIHG